MYNVIFSYICITFKTNKMQLEIKQTLVILINKEIKRIKNLKHCLSLCSCDVKRNLFKIKIDNHNRVLKEFLILKNNLAIDINTLK